MEILLIRSVFLQYVTSGAFDLTVDLVKQILKELSQDNNNEEDSERDIEFKYLLLSKLCEVCHSILHLFLLIY
jgi:hypothetical protein